MAKRGKNIEPWRVGKLEQLFRHTGLFLWSLRGSKPNVIITGYSDHWRGAASKGSQIMTSGSSWRVSIDGFDDFDWLRDLRTFGGSQARSRARSLISNWLKVNGRWNAKSWQPDIMGKRLANLVFCYDWYGSSADETFQKKISDSIGLQARCLAIDWKRLYDHDARVGARGGCPGKHPGQREVRLRHVQARDQGRGRRGVKKRDARGTNVQRDCRQNKVRHLQAIRNRQTGGDRAHVRARQARQVGTQGSRDRGALRVPGDGQHQPRTVRGRRVRVGGAASMGAHEDVHSRSGAGVVRGAIEVTGGC